VQRSFEKTWDKKPHSKEGHRESSEKLGRHRWVVERTLAWLAKYRRLTIRYERREDIHEAFLHLGCSLICLNYLS
jgi:transposase